MSARSGAGDPNGGVENYPVGARNGCDTNDDSTSNLVPDAMNLCSDYISSSVGSAAPGAPS